MKKILALILAAMMVATTAAVVAGANDLELPVDTEAEETSMVEVEEESTGAEDDDEPAVPAGPIAPTVFGNFDVSDVASLVNGAENTSVTLNNGVLELRPSEDDVWANEEEGALVDAQISLNLAWYIRDGEGRGVFTEDRLVMTTEMNYIAVKVKQADNYIEDAGLELNFCSAPTSARNPQASKEGPYYMYSSTMVEAEDGYTYLLFDLTEYEDRDMWDNRVMVTLGFLWASCEAAKRDTVYMDLYEIAILNTEEDLTAYVGTDVEWVTEPEPVVTQPVEDDGDDTTKTTDEGGESILGMLGCQGTIASAVVVVAATVAAGAVVIRKKRED